MVVSNEELAITLVCSAVLVILISAGIYFSDELKVLFLEKIQSRRVLY